MYVALPVRESVLERVFSPLTQVYLVGMETRQVFVPNAETGEFDTLDPAHVSDVILGGSMPHNAPSLAYCPTSSDDEDRSLLFSPTSSAVASVSSTQHDDGGDGDGDDDDDFVMIDLGDGEDAGIETKERWVSPETKAMAVGTAVKAAEVVSRSAAEAAEVVVDVSKTSAALVASVYSAVRNPFSSAYTAREMEQAEGVRRVYADVLGDPPSMLGVSAGGIPGFAGVGERDLLRSSYLRRMGNSRLRMPAEELVSLACAYESERRSRLTGGGYADDPTHAVLAEIKAWARDVLSRMDVDDPSSLDDVGSRIRYLTALLHSGLFPAGASSKTSMERVLLNMATVLETHAVPVITAAVAAASAREDLASVTRHIHSFLGRIVQYLFYVVRDSPGALENVGMAHLMGVLDHSGDLGRALATGSGQALSLLLASPPVQAVLDPRGGRGPGTGTGTGTGTGLLMSSVSGQGASSSSSALVVGGGGGDEVVAPGLPVRTPPVEFVVLLSARHAKTSGSGLGIVEGLVQEDVLDAMSQVHVCAQELALLALLFTRAGSVAGAGGELLLYGLAREEMEALVSAGERLVDTVIECLGVVEGAAKGHHSALVNRRVKAGLGDAAWRRHYSEIPHMSELVHSSLESMKEVMARMRGRADGFDVAVAVEDAKVEVAEFVGWSRDFVRDQMLIERTHE